MNTHKGTQAKRNQGHASHGWHLLRHRAAKPFLWAIAMALNVVIGAGVSNAVAIPPGTMISINDVLVAEGNTGTKIALFSVTALCSASDIYTYTIRYQTSDGSAVAGSDYQATIGRTTLTCVRQAGITIGISVPVLGDTVQENAESFFIDITIVTTRTATVTKSRGVGTITVNDINVAAGNAHTVALKPDGTLWAWGTNFSGQLGNGTNANSNVPVQESTGATNWVAIAGGGSHTVALKADGTLWAWGRNSEGQLGNGTSGLGAFSNVPVQESTGATNWVAVAGGFAHTVALKADGTLWAWGANASGQLGKC